MLAALTASDVVAQSRLLDKARAQRAQVVPESPDPEAPRNEVATEEEKEEPEADSTPLGVDIASIRIIPHQDKADQSPAVGAEPIEIDPEISAPENLTAVLEPYLGQPVSMALLAKLAKEIIVAWRENDYPIVDVYYPEQNITGGKVQIVAREAVFGKVEVEGAKYSKPEYLEKNVRLDAGDRINRHILEADLDWLNENPIRQVNLIYDRGDEDGTSDIILQAIEEEPFTSYLGFGNTGIPLTGENEWSAGFNWANPFRTEQSIGYHFATDAEFETLQAHSLFYRNFLPWRHELRLLATSVNTNVFQDDPAFPSELFGESSQFTLEYRIPLPRVQKIKGLKHSIVTGIDYKTTNTDLLFGGLNALDSSLVVFQFRAQYEAEWPDAFGYTRWSAGASIAPGNVVHGNDDLRFDQLREGASADYVYGYGELERAVKLPAGFQFMFRGTGQLTNERLNSSEQLLAGGYLTVRGFDENYVRGDSGGIISTELISPSFNLLGNSAPELKDQWNVFGFYDAAHLDISNPLPTELNMDLQSAGIGVTCRISKSAFLRASYGWVVDTNGIIDDELADGRAHFGVTMRY